MINFSLTADPIIAILQQYPSEVVSTLLCLWAGASIVSLHRYFGLPGLYTYSSLCVILANIQVLRGIQYHFLPIPIAAGTILITFAFLASDMITEFYGRQAAQRNVWLSFSAALFTSTTMILTVGWPPVGGNGDQYAHFTAAHQAMQVLFTPTFAILAASLCAYIISQYSDILLYSILKRTTGSRWLMARSFITTAAAGFVDNALFSWFAWQVFSVTPLPWSIIWGSYIIGTIPLRLILSLIAPIFLKIARTLHNEPAHGALS